MTELSSVLTDGTVVDSTDEMPDAAADALLLVSSAFALTT